VSDHAEADPVPVRRRDGLHVHPQVRRVRSNLLRGVRHSLPGEVLLQAMSKAAGRRRLQKGETR
jgi:hypothetical protein